MKTLAAIGMAFLMAGCEEYENNNPAVIFDSEVASILEQRIQRNGVDPYLGNNMTMVKLTDGSECGVAYTASRESIRLNKVDCYGSSGKFI